MKFKAAVFVIKFFIHKLHTDPLFTKKVGIKKSNGFIYIHDKT